jgi:uracil-DNA glycosylase family 4
MRGSFRPKIVLVGEAPGRQEDLQGLPFVGPSGKLLNEQLIRIGLMPADFAIVNILKCRPTTPMHDNRIPSDDEVHNCMPFLLRQLKVLDPKIVVSVGNVAKYHLTKAGVKRHAHVMHPAATLHNRDPDLKKVFEEGFDKLKTLIEEASK